MGFERLRDTLAESLESATAASIGVLHGSDHPLVAREMIGQGPAFGLHLF